MSDTRTRVLELFRDFNFDPSLIEEKTSLYDDLQFDSLDSIELVMSAEKAFGIEIQDGAWERLHTVGDVVAMVEAKLEKKVAA